MRELGDLISAGHELTYPYLKELAAELGLKKGDPRADIIRALQPYATDILRFAYQHMAEICRENEIRPVWVFMPLVRTKLVNLRRARSMRQSSARRGSRRSILDNAYGGLKPEEIKISQNDYHPNNLGHRHVARRLLEGMKEQREALGLAAERVRHEPPRAGLDRGSALLVDRALAFR